MSLTTSSVLHACVKASMLQLAIYGLFPGYYSRKRAKFLLSIPLGIYCLVVATLFAVFYVQLMWTDYINDDISQRDVIKIYCYMNVCLCLINYITQWLAMAATLRYQNNLPLLSTLNGLDITLDSIKHALLLEVFKLFGFPLIMLLTLIIYDWLQFSKLSWMNTFGTMLPIYLGNQVNNCFFGSIMLTTGILRQINVLLRDIQLEVNRLQTPLELQLQKPYYRMQRFCELADRLDELAIKFTHTTTNSMSYLKLTGVSLVISLALNLVITTLGFYTQYQAAADYIFTENIYDITQPAVHFVFLVVALSEFYFLSRLSQQALDEANETGCLLQQISLQHSVVDVRFKQEVDAFWLQVRTIQYNLKPLQFLELDGTLVSKIFATVAGFLLFLIQNDLTLRFSLK
ncbi:putative gustatory receptor 97a [Drosophila busckii]|uniref:putative gustatory receptor 97a n=1 Tax=Drosophila busckii TaxID=30019 RepID=UPI00083EBD50|nr:putative gustatory receptor 97a [Drosophila busckii]